MTTLRVASGPAGRDLFGSGPPGQEDQVLVQLEPDGVVALDPR
jgi:hypothetical protein